MATESAHLQRFGMNEERCSRKPRHRLGLGLGGVAALREGEADAEKAIIGTTGDSNNYVQKARAQSQQQQSSPRGVKFEPSATTADDDNDAPTIRWVRNGPNALFLDILGPVGGYYCFVRVAFWEGFLRFSKTL